MHRAPARSARQRRPSTNINDGPAFQTQRDRPSRLLGSHSNTLRPEQPKPDSSQRSTIATQPASGCAGIEDARETIAGIRELERVVTAFDAALQALDDPHSGLWAGMTTGLVFRLVPDQETLVRDLREISPNGPSKTKFLDPHPRVMVL